MSNNATDPSEAPASSPPAPTSASPSPPTEPSPSQEPTPSPSAEPSPQPTPSEPAASQPPPPEPSPSEAPPPEPSSPEPSVPSDPEPEPPSDDDDDEAPEEEPDDVPEEEPADNEPPSDDPPPDDPPPDDPPPDDPPSDNETEDEPEEVVVAPIITVATTAEVPGTSTAFFTSIITESDGTILTGTNAITIIRTSVIEPTTVPVFETIDSAPSTTSTRPAALQSGEGNDDDDGGLSAAGVTAVAVVVPIVVVALLILGGIFWWRRRKQRKSTEEARRKEVEEYGYNPNHDPTLPAVAIADSEMAEDKDGYRGWGNTTNPSNPSNRKGSTTISGMTGGAHSDSGSQPGGSGTPDSPTLANTSDRYSTDPLVVGGVNNPAHYEPDIVPALGTAPVAGANATDVRRGPSNASSSYSAGAYSEHSGEGSTPPMVLQPGVDYHPEHVFHQQGPFPEPHQPVIRDVTARRNTKIENPIVYPQQGNMGISQNF